MNAISVQKRNWVHKQNRMSCDSNSSCINTGVELTCVIIRVDLQFTTCQFNFKLQCDDSAKKKVAVKEGGRWRMFLMSSLSAWTVRSRYLYPWEDCLVVRVQTCVCVCDCFYLVCIPVKIRQLRGIVISLKIRVWHSFIFLLMEMSRVSVC